MAGKCVRVESIARRCKMKRTGIATPSVSRRPEQARIRNPLVRNVSHLRAMPRRGGSSNHLPECPSSNRNAQRGRYSVVAPLVTQEEIGLVWIRNACALLPTLLRPRAQTRNSPPPGTISAPTGRRRAWVASFICPCHRVIGRCRRVPRSEGTARAARESQRPRGIPDRVSPESG
jgi:hypothetical protein